MDHVAPTTLDSLAKEFFAAHGLEPHESMVEGCGDGESVPLLPRLEKALKDHLAGRTSGRVFVPEGHGTRGVG